MISPIKTIIKNLSNSAIRFRVSSRLAVAMAPAGVAGDVAKITGELFSLVDGDRAATYILSMIKAGSIAVSYTVDKAFEIGEAEKINMTVPVGDVSVWYNGKCAEAPVKAKKEEPKKVEEPKQESIKEEPKKVEEPKQEEPKAVESKKVEEPSATPAEVAPKATEEAKAEEQKKETPKAGRKIKVQ